VEESNASGQSLRIRYVEMQPLVGSRLGHETVELVPEIIEYTVVGPEQARRRVRFEYVQRGRREEGFFLGGRTARQYVISRIVGEVSSDGVTFASDRSYEFAYRDGDLTARPLLDSLRLCVAFQTNGVSATRCSAATKLNYQSDAAGQPSFSQIPVTIYPQGAVRPDYFDALAPPTMADLDGDGIADLVRRDAFVTGSNPRLETWAIFGRPSTTQASPQLLVRQQSLANVSIDALWASGFGGQYLLDVNLDGTPELVSHGLSSGAPASLVSARDRVTLPMPAPQFRRVAGEQRRDMDGDGLADIVRCDLTPRLLVVEFARSPIEFEPPVRTDVPCEEPRSGYVDRLPIRSFALRDVSGDGLGDIVSWEVLPQLTGQAVVLSPAIVRVTKLVERRIVTESVTPGSQVGEFLLALQDSVEADINGDGRLDLLFAYNRSRLNVGGVSARVHFGGSRPFLEAMASNDEFSPGSLASAWTVARTYDSGEPAWNRRPPIANNSAGSVQYAYGDINADGKTDKLSVYYFPHESHYRVRVELSLLPSSEPSEASARSRVVDFDVPFAGALRPLRSAFIGDFTGDGQVDVGFANDVGIFVFAGSGLRPERLSGVSGGVDHQTTLTYSRLGRDVRHSTGDSLYFCAASPGCMAGSSVDVVASISRSTATRGSTEYFSYRDGRRDGARGFLGFNQIQRELFDDSGVLLERRVDSFQRERPLQRAGEALRLFPLQSPVSSVVTRPTERGGRTEARRYDWAMGATRPNLIRLSSTSCETIGAGSAPCVLTSSVTATFDSFESWGQPRRSVVRTRNDLSIQVDTTYKAPSATGVWTVGLVERRLVTETRAGRISSRVATYEYLEPTRLLWRVRDRELVAPDGQLIEYAYDAYGQVYKTIVQDRGSGATRQTTVDYWPGGYSVRYITNPVGHMAEYTMHSRWPVPRAITDANGLVTSFQYDGLGRLRSTIGPDGAGDRVNVVAAMAIDRGAVARCESVRADGLESATEVDADGLPVVESFRAFDGTMRYRAFERDSSGRITDVFGPSVDLKMTVPSLHIGYDGWGRMVRRQTSEGRHEYWSYEPGDGFTRGRNAAGLKVTHRNARGFDTQRFFDSSDVLERVIEAGGQDVSLLYGGFHQLVEVRRGSTTLTRTGYDAYGVPRRVDDLSLGTRTSRYNAFGELTSVWSAGSGTVSVQRDALGRMTRRVDGNGRVATWDYDFSPSSGCGDLACGQAQRSVGQLVRGVSEDGVVLRRQFDQFGRLSDETREISGESYTYSFRYDSQARLAELLYPVGSNGTRLSVKHSYRNGFLAAVYDGAGDLASGMRYWERVADDDAGLLQRERFANGVTTTYERSVFTGILTTRTVDSAGRELRNIAYDRDHNGNLLAKRDLVQSVSERFTHDPVDRLVSACFRRSVAPVAPGATAQPLNVTASCSSGYCGSAVVWNPPPVGGGGQAGLPAAPGTSATALGASATVGKGSMAVDVIRSGGVIVDENGGLAGAAPFSECDSISYDAVGNILSSSSVGPYTYPGRTTTGRSLPDAPAQIQGRALAYDDDGRLRSMGATGYSYDGVGRLTAVISPPYVPSSLVYDPYGRRASKTDVTGRQDYPGRLFVRSFTDAPAGVTGFSGRAESDLHIITAGGRPIAQVWRHSSNRTLAQAHARAYSGGGFSNSAVDELRSASWSGQYTVAFLHDDYQGSIDVVSAMDGTSRRQSYTAFGRPRSPDWRSGITPVSWTERTVGFTGHMDDASTGLVDMGGRVYHPGVGRFLSPDPIARAPGGAQFLNRYSYVRNRPTALIDPSGFDGVSVVAMDELFIRADRHPLLPDPEPENPVLNSSQVGPEAWENAAERMTGKSAEVGESAPFISGFMRGASEVITPLVPPPRLQDVLSPAGYLIRSGLHASLNTVVGIRRAYRDEGAKGVIRTFDPVLQTLETLSLLERAIGTRDPETVGAASAVVLLAVVQLGITHTRLPGGKGAPGALSRSAKGGAQELGTTPVSRVGRTFVTDTKGNTLVVPEGGRVTGSPDGSFVQTRRADGSIYQRLDQAHTTPAAGEAASAQKGTAPHGHGMDANGNSLDIFGNIVDRTSPEAHWDAR
jgi:RHS repeat-associated protein